jgi:hypothetical protein
MSSVVCKMSPTFRYSRVKSRLPPTDNPNPEYDPSLPVTPAQPQVLYSVQG